MSDYAPSIDTVWDALPLGQVAKPKPAQTSQEKDLEIRADLRRARRRARRGDPSTSHEAAAGAKDFDAEHYQRILSALGEQELGGSEISSRSGLDRNQVSRRMKELEDGGLVAVVGSVINPRNKREQTYRRLPR